MIYFFEQVKVYCRLSSFHLQTVDIVIKSGVIEAIASKLPFKKGFKKITFLNGCVSLGWFDSGVCFGEPGFENRETLENGLDVAGKSGFTEVLFVPNSQPRIENGSMVRAIVEKSKNHPVSLYLLGNLSLKENTKEMAELYDMKTSGVVGYYDYQQPIRDAKFLKTALLYVQSFEGLIFSFPLEQSLSKNGMVNENISTLKLGLKLIPSIAEELQLRRDISILKYTKGKLHIPTISSKNSIELIKEAKKEKLDISCSVSINNLFFTHDALFDFDSNKKVLPTLKSEEDKKTLLKALIDGDIDMLTADHNPINIELKNGGFEEAVYGSIGLESMFGALNKLVETEEAIDVLTRGRSRFDINQPRLEEGTLANLTFFKPQVNYTFGISDIFSTSKNSAFLKQVLTGKALGVFHNNKLLLNEN